MGDLVPDSLWERVEPLLPTRPPRRYKHPGRRLAYDRGALAGIVFVLKTGIGWNQSPGICWVSPESPAGGARGIGPRLECGRRCTRSCWPGCLPLEHWTWTDARWMARTCEPSKGDHVGASPVDCGRPSSKHHLIVEANGIPLKVTLTGGNRNDVTQLLPLVDSVPPIRGLGAGPGASHVSCSPIVATTTTSIRDCYVPAASLHGLPAAASLTVPDSISTAGWSNAASPCSTPTSDCVPGGNAGPISTSDCYNWPVR